MHYNLYYLFFKTKENSFRFLLITFIFYAIADKYVLPIHTNTVFLSFKFQISTRPFQFCYILKTLI